MVGRNLQFFQCSQELGGRGGITNDICTQRTQVYVLGVHQCMHTGNTGLIVWCRSQEATRGAGRIAYIYKNFGSPDEC